MSKFFQNALKDSKNYIILQGKGQLSLPIQRILDISGPGIGLYFQFVKYLAITYGIMTIFTIIQLIVLYQETGYEQQGEISIFDYETNMAKLTVGNINLNKTKDQKTIDVVIGIDMLNILIFFIFYIWYIKTSVQLKSSQLPLPSKYTLEVSGFPSNVTNNLDILNFFKKFKRKDQTSWNIYNCYLARNYKNTLFYHQEIIDIFSKKLDLEQKKKERQEQGKPEPFLQTHFPKFFDPIQKQNKKLVKTKQSIQKKLQKIFGNKGQMSHDQYDSLKAYVVFQYQSDKQDAYTLFKKYQGRFKKVPLDLQLFNKYKLKVDDKVDEPSGIRWENIEVQQRQRNIKENLVTFLLLVFLIICLCLIVLANLLKPDVQQTLCSAEQWNSNVTWYFIFPEIHDSQCSEAFTRSLTGLSISFAIGSFVFAINTMLKFMRYTSISQELRAQTIQIFCAQFLNTGLLISVLQFDFGGFKLPEFLIGYVGYFQDSNNYSLTYVNDFKRTFYTALGGKIVLTSSILIITPIIFIIFGIPALKIVKKVIAKTKTGKLQIKKALIPSEFELDMGYAIALNTIFTTLFYSSGIPILIPIGFLAFISQYWSFKYRLLRYNKKPPQIDTKLNQKVVVIVPLAIFLHLMVGILVYSYDDIFINSNQGILNELITHFMEDIIGIVNKNQNSQILKRLTYNYFYLLYFILITIILILVNRLQKFIENLSLGCCQSQEFLTNQKRKLNTNSYEDNLSYLEKINIASYDIRKNPRYELLVQTIDDASNQDFSQKFDLEQLKIEEEKMKMMVELQNKKIKEREKQEMHQLKKQNLQQAKEQQQLDKENSKNNQNNEDECNTNEDNESSYDSDDDSISSFSSNKKGNESENLDLEKSQNLDNSQLKNNNNDDSKQQLAQDTFYEEKFIQQKKFLQSHKKSRRNRQSLMTVTPLAEKQISSFTNYMQKFKNKNTQDDAFGSIDSQQIESKQYQNQDIELISDIGLVQLQTNNNIQIEDDKKQDLQLNLFKANSLKSQYNSQFTQNSEQKQNNKKFRNNTNNDQNNNSEQSLKVIDD